jgi:hypothetical protein
MLQKVVHKVITGIYTKKGLITQKKAVSKIQIF